MNVLLQTVHTSRSLLRGVACGGRRSQLRRPPVGVSPVGVGRRATSDAEGGDNDADSDGVDNAAADDDGDGGVGGDDDDGSRVGGDDAMDAGSGHCSSAGCGCIAIGCSYCWWYCGPPTLMLHDASGAAVASKPQRPYGGLQAIERTDRRGSSQAAQDPPLSTARRSTPAWPISLLHGIWSNHEPPDGNAGFGYHSSCAPAGAAAAALAAQGAIQMVLPAASIEPESMIGADGSTRYG